MVEANPTKNKSSAIPFRVESDAFDGTTNAPATQNTMASPKSAKNPQRHNVIRFDARRVSGRYPETRLENAAAPMAPNKKAHPGVLTNVYLRHISAGAPVTAQTGGKSFRISCDCQTWTSANAQTQQLV